MVKAYDLVLFSASIARPKVIITSELCKALNCRLRILGLYNTDGLLVTITRQQLAVGQLFTDYVSKNIPGVCYFSLFTFLTPLLMFLSLPSVSGSLPVLFHTRIKAREG